jgi:outer membrane protein assembly factor BamB
MIHFQFTKKGIYAMLYFSIGIVLSGQVPDTLWMYQIGDGIGEGSFTSVQRTTDGNWIAAGSDPNSGLLTKIDTNGNEIWSHTYDDTSYFSTLQVLPDGGYIAAGNKYSDNYSTRQVWLLRTDSDGIELWSRLSSFDAHLLPRILRASTNGGWMIAGNAINDSSAYGRFILETDSEGNELWSNINWDKEHIRFQTVQPTTDGGWLFAGFGEGQGHLMQIDALGNEIWNKSYGDTNVGSSSFRSLQPTAEGGWIVGGSKWDEFTSSTNAWLIKVDANGEEVWSNTYGDQDRDYINSIQPTIQGGWLLAGRIRPVSGDSDSTRGLIIETDSGGNELWKNSYGDTYTQFIDHQTTISGGSILAGVTRSENGASYDGLLLRLGVPGPALRLQYQGDRTVELSWRQIVGQVIKYRIYRSNDESTFALIDSIEGSPPDTAYTDGSLLNGFTYFYKIVGVRGDNTETPFSNIVSATPGLPILFELSTSGSIESGVTLLDENSLYVASSGAGVYRFDDNGNEAYKLNVNGDIKSSTTITSNHTVYIASTDNNLYSFNANGISNTGWPVSLGAEATASVAVDANGVAYIGTSNGIFQAIASNGTVEWGYNVGGAVYSSSAISSNKMLYVVNENGRVYSFNLNFLNPSAIEYSAIYELGSGVSSSPALDGLGNIYITTNDGSLVKLQDNGDSFSESWRFDTGYDIVSSPVISAQYDIYFGGQDSAIYAVDSTGQLKWRVEIDEPIQSTGALAEFGTQYDRLFIASLDGFLYSVKMETGELIWKYNAESPIVCPILFENGTVYFGTMDGQVLAISDNEVVPVLAKTATVNPVWHTFQGNNARTGVFGGGTLIPTISNVHPGDADNDGDVDAQDILPLGVYFLEQGSSRSSATMAWSSQEVTSWESYPANYADCNGDGVVDEKDIIAIGVNWGQTHDDILLKYQIDPSNKQILAQYNESFQRLYASLESNEGAPGRAMKRVLEEVLGVMPSNYVLYQNYPNPFNPDTEIQFSLPKATQVSLSIYNIRGELVAELVDGKSLQDGYHTKVFRGSTHSSGIYFYELSTPEFNAVNKMLLVK